MPPPRPYHPFDAFGEEEAVIQSAHGVIWEDLTLLLEQNVPSVQTIICPKDGKSPFFISMNKGPKEKKNETLSLAGKTTEYALGIAPAIPQHTSLFPSSPGRIDACSGKSGKEKKMVFIDTNHIPGIVVKAQYTSFNLIFPVGITGMACPLYRQGN